MGKSSAVERWLPIPGTDGYYEASSHGRVRSVDRTVWGRDGVAKHLRGRVLKSYIDEQGRLRVTLYTARKSFDVRLVSQLVLTVFKGPRPDGMVGCHNNGDPSNNRPENLRWDTPKENNQDTIRHGRNFQKNKERCKYGHLLVKPNLAGFMERKGYRNCLACDRARAAKAITSWQYTGQPCPYSFEELAAAYYAKIMGLPLPDPAIEIHPPRKEHDRCLRGGHLLIEPNLVPSALKKNKRICLACQRTRSAQSNAIGRGDSPPDFVETADRYYDEIMRGKPER